MALDNAIEEDPGTGTPAPPLPPAPPPPTEPPSGIGTADATAQAYVQSTNPRQTFRAFTINGLTYLLNTSITVTMDANAESSTLGGTAQTLQDNLLDTGTGVWQIIGDGDNAFDTYYANNISGKWFEWYKLGIPKKLTQATMPCVIQIDSATGDYVLSRPTYAELGVGDTKSNKPPSFVGRTIAGMFSIGDRLGFLSGQGYIMSETAAGEPEHYYNFWRNTVTDVLDTQRIDGTVASDTTVPLMWAKSVGKSMILFADQRQFSMDWNGAVTPRTLSVTPATSYEANMQCPPAQSGTNLYFTADVGRHSAMYEMFIQPDTVLTEAANIAAHCPNYLPKNMRLLETAPHFNMLFCVSEDQPDTVYVHSSLWSENKRIQSAWNKWTYTDCDIRSMKVIGEYLYVVYCVTASTAQDPLFVGRISLKAHDPGAAAAIFDHAVHLDHLQQATGVYHAGTNTTRFTTLFPYGDHLTRLQIVAYGDPALQGKVIRTGFVRVTNAYTFSVPGNYNGKTFFVGIGYTQRYVFSQQYPDVNGRAALNAVLSLRYMTVAFTNSGFFRTRVSTNGNSALSTDFNVDQDLVELWYPRTVGDSGLMLNTPTLETGKFRFPVLGRSEDVTITLSNDSHLPSTFVSAEWIGLAHIKSKQ